MLPILLSLLPTVVSPDSVGVLARDPSTPPPAVKLWLSNSRQFREGERARVQVEARDDGYLVVINYDTEGRLRMLFPVDPREDNFIRGGRRYEVQGRGDRESFIVEGSGDGLVYAAISADPFRFEEFEAGGNWDYNRIYVKSESRDPEAEISDLLQRMTSDRGFDYDLLTYRVYGYRNYVNNNYYPRSGYYPSYGSSGWCDPWFPSYFRCPYYGRGWYLGFGYDWYDPWRYRYSYSPYSYYPYNYYPYAYNPFGYRPIIRDPNYKYPVIVGRPRGYTITRQSFGGSGALGGGGTAVAGTPRGGTSSDGVIYYRPRRHDPIDRPGQNGGNSDQPAGSEAGRGTAVTGGVPAQGGPARRSRPGSDGAYEGSIWNRDPGARGMEPGDRPRRDDVIGTGQGRSMIRPDGPQVDRPVITPDRERARPVFEPRSRDDLPPARRANDDGGGRSQPIGRGWDGPRGEVSRPRYEPRGESPRSSPPPRMESPRSAPPPASHAGGGSRSRPRGRG